MNCRSKKLTLSVLSSRGVQYAKTPASQTLLWQSVGTWSAGLASIGTEQLQNTTRTTVPCVGRLMDQWCPSKWKVKPKSTRPRILCVTWLEFFSKTPGSKVTSEEEVRIFGPRPELSLTMSTAEANQSWTRLEMEGDKQVRITGLCYSF